VDDFVGLGWDEKWSAELAALGDGSVTPARVVGVDRGRVDLWSPNGPRSAWLAAATGELETPVVGDWVAYRESEDGTATLVRVLPRRSLLVRRAAGREPVPQPLVANVDFVLITTAVGGDFSPRRVERYAAATWAGGAEPVIVLSKVDLAEDVDALVRELRAAVPGARVYPVSAPSGRGLEALVALLSPGKTFVLVGSSGVGKSTLINHLLGEERFATSSIREHDETGRHTTTRRELVKAPSGALLIDTPGMREFGLWEADEGLPSVFPEIEALTARCRFRDCRHDNEPGCAVRDALRAGTISEARFASYRALRAELEQASGALRERKDRRAIRGRRPEARRARRPPRSGSDSGDE